MTSPIELAHRPGMNRNEDKLVKFHLSVLVYLLTSWLLSRVVSRLPFFNPASRSDLDARPVRTEPEGESGPPESDKPPRMESAEKKDAERGLTSHTNVAPLSPLSPASSSRRSKRKEGKGIKVCLCSSFLCWKQNVARHDTVPLMVQLQSAGGRSALLREGKVLVMIVWVNMTTSF